MGKKLLYKIARIPAKDLAIHPVAQRAILPNKLKNLVANMDLDAVGVLHAVQYSRHGATKIWIIDGQHRWQALIDLGLGDWEVDVKIHLDVTDDARASALFLKLNDRAVVKPYPKFCNEVQSGDPIAVGAKKIAESFGLKISDGCDDGCITCVATLKEVYSKDEGKALIAALRSAIAAWGKTSESVEGKLIGGIGLLFGQYNGDIDEASLIKKLSKYPGGPSHLLGTARGRTQLVRKSVTRCVALTIIDLYNVGLRTGRLDPL